MKYVIALVSFYFMVSPAHAAVCKTLDEARKAVEESMKGPGVSAAYLNDGIQIDKSREDDPNAKFEFQVAWITSDARYAISGPVTVSDYCIVNSHAGPLARVK